MFNKDLNVIEIEKILDTMYDVSNVKVGFRYWFFKLLNITLDLFTYDGLPEGGLREVRRHPGAGAHPQLLSLRSRRERSLHSGHDPGHGCTLPAGLYVDFFLSWHQLHRHHERAL